MKLYDELLAANPIIPEPNLANYETYGLLVTSVHFDASNISKYLQTHDMKPEDIPSIRPPFDYTWWETAIPTKFTRRHGAIAYRTSWGDGDWGRYNISEDDYSRDIQDQMADEVYWSVFVDGKSISPSEYRRLGGSEWGGSLRGGIHRRVMFEIGIPMDSMGRPFIGEDGQIVARDLSANPLLHHRGGGDSYEALLRKEKSGEIGHNWTVTGYRRGLVKRGLRYVWPFLVAIGFSHCKNVEIVESEEIPYKVRRKQELKLGAPVTRFRELVIDPTRTQRQVIDTRPSTTPDKPSKSLHICRGHFATYTEDRKLFGKLVGSFWIPAHVRGSDDVGTVYKDYNVQT